MDVKRKFYPLTNDIIFKRALTARQDVLRRLLSLILEIPEADLAGMHMEDTSLKPPRADGKVGVLDIRVGVAGGDVINVEMQTERQDTIRERLLFYLGGMIFTRPRRGQGHGTGGRCVSILIAGFNAVPETEDYHSTFFMYDERHGIRFSDSVRIDVFDLPKLPRRASGPLEAMLRTFTLNSEEDLMEHARMHPEAAGLAAATLDMNQDEGARRAAEWWDMHLRDVWEWRAADRREGREEGIVIGERRGRKQGREEGEWNKALTIARSLLASGMDPVLVSQHTGLPLEAVLRLKGDLQ